MFTNRPTLAAKILAGTALSATLVGATLASTGESATAQARPATAHTASSSTGVHGSGIDSGGADDGSYSGSYKATGIHTSHGRGYADASVSNLTIGGKSLGSVTVTCRQGVTHVSHSGAIGSSPFLHVTYGAGGGSSTTGLVATVTDAHGRVAQTVRAASVSCEHIASTPITPHRKPSQRTNRNPSTHESTGAEHYGRGSESNAPAPVPAPGHVSVTG